MSKTALLQFVNAKGAGEATIRRLADFVMREGIAPEDAMTMGREDLAQTIGTTEEIARNIQDARQTAQEQADQLHAHGVQIIWLADPNYPTRLRAILGDDAPPILFAKGNLALLEKPAVGFCGSRKASSKGLGVTEATSRILAEHQICAISGYAHGVDMAAHRAAMKAGGTTIMVLVDGILRFKVKKDIEDVLSDDNHLVISQFPPKLTWIGRNAMKRNSTIIGLSDAMILVESGTTGGTFAAGTESLKRRHPLFVIDFAQPGPSAEANPYFIERGGIPVRGNREHVPNLEKVLDAVKQPRWKESGSSQSLFQGGEE